MTQPMFSSLLHFIHVLLPIISVVAVLLVLVVAHEMGHFLAAKACRMRVDEFSVGFGSRKLTLFKQGVTEYNLRPIPAGGFVRIAGMEPGEEGPPDGFNAQSVWKRMIVIFAGPLAGFVFAYLVFCSLGMTVGLPLGEPDPVVAAVQPGSEAARMGLKAGDRFVQIEGKAIHTGEEMMKAIRSHPSQRIKALIRRDGQDVVLYGTPKLTRIDGHVQALLGFTPAFATRVVGFGESVREGTILSYNLVKKLVEVIFSKQIAKEAGGPIAIFEATHSAAQQGFADLAALTAILSLNFSVLNLLPIPILDGGLLMLLFVEVVRGRRLSAKAQQTALAIGMACLAVIVVLVLAKDISSLLGPKP